MPYSTKLFVGPGELSRGAHPAAAAFLAFFFFFLLAASGSGSGRVGGTMVVHSSLNCSSVCCSASLVRALWPVEASERTEFVELARGHRGSLKTSASTPD